MDYSGGGGEGNSSGCSSHHPVRRVEAECQGRQTCSLLVNRQNLLADLPWCPHTSPHLQLSVTHQCRPNSLRTRLSCPGSSLALSCRHQPGTQLFVMVSSANSDWETLLHYCGPQEDLVTDSPGQDTNSSLTRLVVAACHGLAECEVSLASPHLLKTVYSCVSEGVINLDQIIQYRTTTTRPTTTTSTTISTSSTTSTTSITTTITQPTTTESTKLTMKETTRTSSIDFTSFKTFIPRENKKVNKSLENDQLEGQVRNIVVLKFKPRFVQSSSF